MKNDKKETIKDILNNDTFSDNSAKSPSQPVDKDENSNFTSKVNSKEDDISDNISSSGKSDNDDESSNTSSGDACSRTSNNSNNFILDIAVLNEISKACHIAMNNISYLSNRICDREMKKELVAIYSQYAHILLKVDQHFEKYGEIPASIPNSLKIMGQTGIRLNIKFDRSPSHIAEIMIQGENMGIIKCQKLLNMNYDVQESTTTLLKTFKDFQKENISTLSRYL